MKKLTILVFTRDVDRYSVRMLGELKRQGHAVHAVLEPPGPQARDWSAEIDIVERVKLRGRFDKHAAARYAAQVETLRPDVCLCYTSRALAVALTAKRRHRFRTPIVGTRGAIGGISAFYLQDWFAYLSPSLDAVVGMSQAIVDKVSAEARRFYPSHPGIFQAIYPGYGHLMTEHPWPVPRLRAPGETTRLLCIANDRPIKGLAVLLQAMDQHMRAENWTLDIVGECGEKVRQTIQASSRLSAHVTAHGYRKDVPEFLKAAHIYIQPTLAPGEGIGNSMAEAMSYGLPVVTSNVGGGIELTVDGQSGVHFQAGNPAALAAAVEGLIHDPERCDALGQAAAARLQERFSLQQEAADFLTLFERVLSRRD